MSNQENFPGLDGETSNTQQSQQTNSTINSWDQEIITDSKKNKKRLKLPTSNNSNFDFSGGQQQQPNFAPQQQQQQQFDFSGGFNFNPYGQQQEFDFSGGQQMNFGYNQYTQFNQQQQQYQQQYQQQSYNFNGQFDMSQLNSMLGIDINQPPYYTYSDKSEGYGELVIKDQFGNYYELEPNQYLENGQIYEWAQEENDQDHWNQYNKTSNKTKSQQQDQNKKSTKKEAKKEAKKPVQPPQPIKPKVYKRELKQQNQTEEQKQQELMGVLKKQERFTIKQLQEKEKELLQTMGDKYYRLGYEKEPINLVFIGHVDAGKSTLSGRVLVDAKEIDEKTLSQFEAEAKSLNRDSWFFAYAMDISEDERAKGKTVETGKAFFELSNRRFTLLDAPGHKNYVPNMIAGACQSDMACLIISSKPGEFESGFEKGGQTTEHVQLIKALGVQKLCCVVTKMDLCEWSEERYNQIKNTLKPWLATVGGFKDVAFIPVDTIGGQNISGRVDAGLCKWYNGQHLFEYLNSVEITKRDSEGAVKIPILDVQKEEGKVFIYGKIESGNIFEDIWVTTMPNRRTFQIQEIYDAKDRRLYYAAAGENIKFKVKGIEFDDLKRGYIVCSTDELCGVANELLAEIDILELPPQKQIMSNGYTCIMHMHTIVQEIEIEEVMAVYDKTHGKMIKSAILKAGDKGMIKINSEKYLCLEKYSDVEFLGRFTLRDENSTIAYGTVKKYKPAFEFQRILVKQKEQQKKEQK